jgi:hypothetical protein
VPGEFFLIEFVSECVGIESLPVDHEVAARVMNRTDVWIVSP